MADDIVDRLRQHGEGCTCEAWSTYDCGCGAEWGENYVREAADEIERLRRLAAQLAEALELQCQFHRVPVTTRPYYTQHARDALAAFKEEHHG